MPRRKAIESDSRFARHVRGFEALRLQRERCQWRTQLMGRVRQESPLHGDGLGDARQKSLDRDDERPDLERQPHIGDLTPVRFRAALEVVRDALQRPEHPADRDADHERQKNDQAQERRNGAQRALVRDLVADSRLLADGDAEAAARGC